MQSRRAQELAKALPKNFGAALLGTEASRFYLLDFDAGDAGHLLLFPDKLVYIIDSRYIEIARRRVTNAEVLQENDAQAQIKAALKAAGVNRLLLEDGMPIAEWSRLKETIPEVEYDISSTLSNALMKLRQIKDEEEIARMRRAQAVTDACFEYILPFIKEGVREIDLTLEMERYMRSHGAEKIAFDTICLGGANGSLPHGEPGAYRLCRGDLITMDFGARVEGYCADMTRTVALGEPGEEKRRVYDTVLRAHLAGIAAAAPGKTGKEVDAAARGLIAEAGYGANFGHGLGHGVGIRVHESPRFSPKCGDGIKAGMMMTVEPGVYLEGRFGCRIEDMVLVTQTGCEPLPQSPKELLILQP